MARTLARLLLLAVAGVVLAGSASAARQSVSSKITLGPTRLLSPGFGYTVVYKTSQSAEVFKRSVGLFVFDRGHWRDVTPPTNKNVNEIDDVAFTDRNHGWVLEYACGNASDYLYRTVDGGRSWQNLGRVATRSCGGGPTFLSFADSSHGWMEPLTPNAPGGALLQTTDAGMTWKTVFGSGSWPCFGPMRFASRSTGWAGRCGDSLFRSSDGGRHWKTIKIAAKQKGERNLDLPRFSGKSGVVAATFGKKASAVGFFVSFNRGSSWKQSSLRHTASCPLRQPIGGGYQTYWPESVVSPKLWWIVSGAKHVTVQLTSDGGRHWSSIKAKGLPSTPCAMTSVSAASARVAWATASFHGGYANALYATRNGGKTWKQVKLTPRVKLSP